MADRFKNKSVEEQNQMTGTPLFKDKKIKEGWTLNLFKQNEQILSTSLYDSGGRMVENKAFLTQYDDEIALLREYIELFEESPEKNYKKMSRIKTK